MCLAQIQSILYDTLFADKDKPMSVIQCVACGIGEFNSAEEDWSSYSERLEELYIANDVQDASKRRATLLSACGAGTYTLICSLVAPNKPSEYTFKRLVELVGTYHNPKPSVTVQRHKFYTHVQHPGESVAAFVAELRWLSEHCDFGTSLDVMIRDRMVCGVHDVRIQRRLLSEPALAYKNAFSIVQSMELASKNLDTLHHADSGEHSSVHKVKRGNDRPSGARQGRVWYRCGGKLYLI